MNHELSEIKTHSNIIMFSLSLSPFSHSLKAWRNRHRDLDTPENAITQCFTKANNVIKKMKIWIRENLDRVGADDFAIEALGEFECKAALTGAGGPGNDYNLLLFNAGGGEEATATSEGGGKGSGAAEERGVGKVTRAEATRSTQHFWFRQW